MIGKHACQPSTQAGRQAIRQALRHGFLQTVGRQAGRRAGRWSNRQACNRAGMDHSKACPGKQTGKQPRRQRRAGFPRSKPTISRIKPTVPRFLPYIRLKPQSSHEEDGACNGQPSFPRNQQAFYRSKPTLDDVKPIFPRIEPTFPRIKPTFYFVISQRFAKSNLASVRESNQDAFWKDQKIDCFEKCIHSKLMAASGSRGNLAASTMSSCRRLFPFSSFVGPRVSVNTFCFL